MSKSIRSKSTLNYVTIKNYKMYGKIWRGIKIFFEGRKPKKLKKDGRINFGKHILENLKGKFDRFHWIISKDIDSIEIKRGIHKVRTSVQLLDKMDNEFWDRRRDIKNDIVRHFFSITFPKFFKKGDTGIYVPGTLSRIVNPRILYKLSKEDKNALINFLPGFISLESIASVNLLKANTEIKSLKELADNFRQSIEENHSESWWQRYIRGKILLIQQGYIKAIEKMNISIGNTKFPDFSLVTHDNYLDILEIKKPDTNLIKPDDSRGNYFWDTELSKAIIQVENYLESITNNDSKIRDYLFDTHKIQLKVLRPRGIILAGNTKKFQNQKEKNDFRLLSSSLKNITIVTYDELLTRLVNYIKVLEEFSDKTPDIK